MIQGRLNVVVGFGFAGLLSSCGRRAIALATLVHSHANILPLIPRVSCVVACIVEFGVIVVFGSSDVVCARKPYT